MSAGVELIDLAPQPVASIVVPDIPSEAVGAALHGTLPDVFSHLQANGVAMVGAPFVRYHPAASGAAERFNIEAGIPVGGPFPETDRIRAGTLPGGPAITTLHVGSYDGLPGAFDSLMAWRAEHGRDAAAHWEIYEDDPSTTPAEELRTRLVAPLVS